MDRGAIVLGGAIVQGTIVRGAIVLDPTPLSEGKMVMNE
jgi:hypothetical protein